MQHFCASFKCGFLFSAHLYKPSDFNFTCIVSGMGAGTFNIQLDRALAGKLRVSSVPSIIAIVGGKAKHYAKDDISLQLIREFIRGLIPEDTVTKVRSMRLFQCDMP